MEKDALIPRKVWAPRSLSPEGERTLLSLIELGREKGMISHDDAAHAKALLKVNPTAQLCLLGTRIEALRTIMKEVENFDARISTMLTGIERSHTLLASLLGEEKEKSDA